MLQNFIVLFKEIVNLSGKQLQGISDGFIKFPASKKEGLCSFILINQF